jgi:putative transposase
MKTHYHLLLETPRGNLVEGMKWLQGTFSQRYNAIRKQCGHVFAGRYKAKLVDEDPAYFGSAGLYILLNPVDAGLIDLRTGKLEDYEWSAYGSYLKPSSKRPKWLETKRLMTSCGIASDTLYGRRAFGDYVRSRGLAVQLKNLNQADEKAWKAMERGWVHGSKNYRESMTRLLEDRDAGQIMTTEKEQRRDIGQSAANKALEKGLRVCGLKKNELALMRKGEERKLLLAGWVRKHFPVSARWCASQLHMGHVSTVARATRFYNKASGKWSRLGKKLDQILDFTG